MVIIISQHAIVNKEENLDFFFPIYLELGFLTQVCWPQNILSSLSQRAHLNLCMLLANPVEPPKLFASTLISPCEPHTVAMLGFKTYLPALVVHQEPPGGTPPFPQQKRPLLPSLYPLSLG